MAQTGANSRNLRHRALEVATQIGSRIEQARAHHGIGQSLRAAGQPGQAQDHLRRAHAIFTELGVPDADQIEAAL